MSHIVLDDQQAELITRTHEHIQVRDVKGNLLGYIEPLGFTAEEILEAKRRLKSDEPRFTTDQVLAHLESLENQ